MTRVSWSAGILFLAALGCGSGGTKDNDAAPKAEPAPTKAEAEPSTSKDGAPAEPAPTPELWFKDAGQAGVPAGLVEGDSKISAVLAGQKVQSLSVEWRWSSEPTHPEVPISQAYSIGFDWSGEERDALEKSLAEAGFPLTAELGGKAHARGKSLWLMLSQTTDSLMIAYNHPPSDSRLPSARDTMPIPAALTELTTLEGGQPRILRYQWVKDEPEDLHDITLAGYVPGDEARMKALRSTLETLGGPPKAIDDDPDTTEWLWTQDGWTTHARIAPDYQTLQAEPDRQVLVLMLSRPPEPMTKGTP